MRGPGVHNGRNTHWKGGAHKAQQGARDKLRDLTSSRFCWMPIQDVVARGCA
jgi:hypothetical protein